MQKILIVGVDGLNMRTDEIRIESHTWKQLKTPPNIKDFDIVILHLETLHISGLEITDYNQFINEKNAHELLGSNGVVVVIGNPAKPLTRVAGGSRITLSTTSWTGIDFTWDPQGGDTSTLNDTYRGNFKNIYNMTARWDYSLTSSNFNPYLSSKLSPTPLLDAMILASRNTEYSYEYEISSIIQNRYNRSVSFSLEFLQKRGPAVIRRMGEVIFIHSFSNSPSDEIFMVLNNVFRISLSEPLPDWIKKAKVVGEEKIEHAILSEQSEISRIQLRIDDLSNKLVAMRDVTKLLYEKNETLERIVRSALQELGATVSEASNRGDYDGWVEVTIGGVLHNAVLEVKSTKNDEFDIQGLRQVREWQANETYKGKENVKPLFVGNSNFKTDPAHRKPSFSDQWRKSATTFDVVAITTTRIFDEIMKKRAGSWDADAFWHRLFNTSGIFE